MKEKQFYILLGNRVQLDFDEMARIQYIYSHMKKENGAGINTQYTYILYIYD